MHTISEQAVTYGKYAELARARATPPPAARGLLESLQMRSSAHTEAGGAARFHDKEHVA